MFLVDACVEYKVGGLILAAQWELAASFVRDDGHHIGIGGKSCITAIDGVSADEVTFLLIQFLSGVLDEVFRFHGEAYDGLPLCLVVAQMLQYVFCPCQWYRQVSLALLHLLSAICFGSIVGNSTTHYYNIIVSLS